MMLLVVKIKSLSKKEEKKIVQSIKCKLPAISGSVLDEKLYTEASVKKLSNVWKKKPLKFV